MLGCAKARLGWFNKINFALALIATSLSGLPARAQLVINGIHTITVTGGKAISINGPIIGNPASILDIEGVGIVDLATPSNNFEGNIFIRGAKFHIHKNGIITNSPSFWVGNGGTLILDNSTTTEKNYITDSSSVTLYGGSIRIAGRSGEGNLEIGEYFGSLYLIGGANIIEIIKNNKTGIIVGSPTKKFS